MIPEFINQLHDERSTRLQAAVRMGSAACEVLVRHFSTWQTGSVSGTKSGIHGDEGLVTTADLEAEKAILDLIRREFPNDQILSEESAPVAAHVAVHSVNVRPTDSLFTWVVDPLDGTNNFACGVPQFSVSIACCRNGQTELGLVIDPLRNDWFVAALGHGAWHNGKRVHVSGHDSFERALIGVGFYYDRGEMMRATLRSIEDVFAANALGVRRFGSAALDLVNVGLGRFGGYFEYTLSPWDFAAGMLFVTEAGGQVSDCRQAPLTLKRTSVLATNGLLHGMLGEIVGRNCPRNI